MGFARRWLGRSSQFEDTATQHHEPQHVPRESWTLTSKTFAEMQTFSASANASVFFGAGDGILSFSVAAAMAEPKI